MAVNYRGTLNIIKACKALGCKRIVMSSSPSTRMDGGHIEGLREDQMKIPKKFLQVACLHEEDQERVFCARMRVFERVDLAHDQCERVWIRVHALCLGLWA